MIDALTPEAIGGLHGRKGSLTQKMFESIAPKVRILLFSIAVLIGLLIWSAQAGVLLGPDVPSAFGLYIHPGRSPTEVRLPLLLDPVAIIVILNSLAVPLFCEQQIAGIRGLNRASSDNVKYRQTTLPAAELNELIRRINSSFSLIGTRTVSLAVLLLAGTATFFIARVLHAQGVLRSWNASTLKSNDWRKIVYKGWWANEHKHLPFAVALFAVATYLYYHLIKQLLMGAIFAIYAQRALRKGFGALPNLAVNTDGYYGQRKLRYFMQWTFAATIMDFAMTLGVMVVWLPFTQLTVFVELLVVASNFLVVLYPTSIAVGGSILEKKMYVAHLQRTLPTDEILAATERAWSISHLPFKVRGAVGVVTLYFLAPITLAVFSAVIGAR